MIAESEAAEAAESAAESTEKPELDKSDSPESEAAASEKAPESESKAEPTESEDVIKSKQSLAKDKEAEEAEQEAWKEDTDKIEKAEEENEDLSLEEEQEDEMTKARRLIKEEYDRILDEIRAQNKIVAELKEVICEKCKKKCLSRSEERELKSLRCCLEKENLKLTCLLKKATNIQEQCPCMDWVEIPIATTFEEDNMPIGINYNILMSACKKSLSEEIRDEEENKRASATKKDEKNLEKLLCVLLEKIQDKKSCKHSKSDHVCRDSGSRTPSPQCKIQYQQDKQRTKSQSKTDYNKMCKELNRCYSMQEKLVADNADLECNRFQLQEEILSRDRMIECLQQKVQIMQCELQKLMKESNCEKLSSSPKGEKKLEKFKQCIKVLQNNIDCMETSIQRLKCEVESLKKERNQWKSKVEKEEICKSPKKKRKCDEMEELRANYMNLLKEYCKKESELKELQKQCGDGDYSKNKDSELTQTEIQLLNDKVKDLEEEQEEFKCLIKEQSEQMEEYRHKYMIAQQKVEEQNCIIEKLELNNKRIEEQINLEIQKIKSKFQEKLQDLAKLPKLLENEQIKLAGVCKEKEELEQKLRLVCKELKALKAQLGDNDAESVKALNTNIAELEQKLATLEKECNNIKLEKDLLSEKLKKTEEDLNTLRMESAKIISGTKQRAESQRQTLQCRIDKLEKELAQCRATACMSIADREDVITEMKGQLSTLSYCFDSAQKQIKTLKNHISYLSNEQTCPSASFKC